MINKYNRPNGIRFEAQAGTTEFAKRWDPQPGDVVSFKHHGFLLASKKPKFPTLHRVRTDVKWEDVVSDWQKQKITRTGKLSCFIYYYHHEFTHNGIHIFRIRTAACEKKKGEDSQTEGLLDGQPECEEFLYPVCTRSRL